MTGWSLPAATRGLALVSGDDTAGDRYRLAFAAAYAREVVVAVSADAAAVAGAAGAEVVFAPADAPEPGRAIAAQLKAQLTPVPEPWGLAGRGPAATAGARPPRVCLFGPESTGKSTLGRALAAHFDTLMIPEYGRTWTETFGQDCGPDDIRRIVLGHLAGVKVVEGLADRLLVEDTDPVLTAIWSDVLLGARDPWFETFSDPADLYLLTATDVPWEADGVRYFPADEARDRFHRLCREELDRRGLPWVEIRGDPAERLRAAITAIAAAVPGWAPTGPA